MNGFWLILALPLLAVGCGPALPATPGAAIPGGPWSAIVKKTDGTGASFGGGNNWQADSIDVDMTKGTFNAKNFHSDSSTLAASQAPAYPPYIQGYQQGYIPGYQTYSNNMTTMGLAIVELFRDALGAVTGGRLSNGATFTLANGAWSFPAALLPR